MRKVVRVIVLLIAVVLCSGVSVYADSVDDAIKARIENLYSLLGNTYFTTDRQSAGSSSDRSLNSAIIKQTWFKEMFGVSSLSVSQFPGSPRTTPEAKSCSGFASFAEWYIFKNSNFDYIKITELSKMYFNYSNVVNNAKIGDIISLSGTKADGSTAGHEFIFISADSNGAYVLDSNWGNSCKVTKHYISYSYCSHFQIGRATNRADIGGSDVETLANPTINAIKANGTQVTVSWDSVLNATSYLCEIRKSENDFPLACNSVTTSQTSCVVDLTEGGTYYACVYAYNGNVSSGANWHIFGTPGRPKIKNVSTNGEYVTITWDATNYTTRYECKILKSEEGFPWACNPIETTETSCTVMLPEGGTYYALITALDSSGCSGTDWYILGTPGTPSVNSIVSNGDQVTIQWNTTAYTTYYRCTILKAADNFPMACDPIETTDTTCTFTLPEGGTYYAVVNSCNSNGNSGSEWTIFGTAGRPSINNISANGNKVSINWDATENTRDYTCNILKAEDGFPLACAPIETSDTTCTVTLPEGKNYYAVIYAHNSIGSSGSNWRLFAVLKIPYTSSTVTKKGNNHSIKVVPVNIDSSCEVIIAGYKCGKFITLANVPYESKEINTTLTGDIDEIKVMVWDSLTALKPLCVNETIPSSAWIVELQILKNHG